MVSKEDYDIAYILYDEGRKFEATSESLRLKSLSESNEVVQEDLRKNLRSYVDTIVKRVQEVWDRFKKVYIEKQDPWEKDEINDAINNYDPKIVVKNYLTYDEDIFNKVKVQPIQYSTMKSHLDSEEDFMKTYYGSIYTDASKSIKENLREKAIYTKTDSYNITKDDLIKMLEFHSNSKTIIDNISTDLESINKSSKNTDYISSVVSEMYSFLNEDGENEISAPAADKPDNSPAGSQASDDSNKKAEDVKSQTEKEDNSEKKVQMYFSCVTKILSAEMEIAREIDKFYSKVLVRQYNDVQIIKKKAEKAKKKEEKKNNKEQPAEGGQGPSQIKI